MSLSPSELTPVEQKAYNHWKKFLPKMTADLERQGKLKETLQEAAEAYLDESYKIEQAILKKHPDRESKDHMTRAQMHEDATMQANEITLPRYILLAPEGETTE